MPPGWEGDEEEELLDDFEEYEEVGSEESCEDVQELVFVHGERVHTGCRTSIAHQQCADALATISWRGSTLLVLSRDQRLALFDPEHSDSELFESPPLPFAIYSLACDATGWVAAAGAARGQQEATNVALLWLSGDKQPSSDGEAPSLRLVHSFGLDPPPPFVRRLQVNSVRFGNALLPGGSRETRRVLLVGSQDERVYALALPPPPSELRGPLPACLAAPLVSHVCVTPINCADASPDGRWLAAVGDREELFLIGGAQGYLHVSPATQRLTLTLSGGPSLPAFAQGGCQYVAWSGDCSLVAVSSDALHSAAVWAVPADSSAPPQPLARFHDFDSPVLALAFLPASHHLAFIEEQSRLRIADIDAAGLSDGWDRPLSASNGRRFLAGRGVQLLRLTPQADDAPPMMWLPAPSQRTTGLCCAPGGVLYASLGRTIHEFTPLVKWSPATHSLFPPAFKAVVRLLLLANRSEQPQGECSEAGGPCLLAQLPLDLLLADVVAKCALPQSAWLPAREDAAEEAAIYAERHAAWERRYGEGLSDDEGLSEDDMDLLASDDEEESDFDDGEEEAEAEAEEGGGEAAA